jgi:multiple sugar transport system permease protein
MSVPSLSVPSETSTATELLPEVSTTVHAKKNWTDLLAGGFLDGVLIIASFAMLLPVLYAFINSLEPPGVAFHVPPVWIPHRLTLHNYVLLFSELPFLRDLANSLIVTLAVVGGSTVVSVLAAYAFARLEFRGSGALFGMMLAALMVPTQIAAVPEFLIVRHLHLINTLPSLIVPALIQVFGLFLLRQHFKTIPKELEDAIHIDGGGHMKVLRHVVVPLSWPAIVAVCIITGQYIWNDFFWPNLFISSPDRMVAPLALVSFSSGNGAGAEGPVFAGVTILLVPILLVFVFLQKRLTESVGFAGISR